MNMVTTENEFKYELKTKEKLIIIVKNISNFCDNIKLCEYT